MRGDLKNTDKDAQCQRQTALFCRLRAPDGPSAELSGLKRQTEGRRAGRRVELKEFSFRQSERPLGSLAQKRLPATMAAIKSGEDARGVGHKEDGMSLGELANRLLKRRMLERWAERREAMSASTPEGREWAQSQAAFKAWGADAAQEAGEIAWEWAQGAPNQWGFSRAHCLREAGAHAKAELREWAQERHAFESARLPMEALSARRADWSIQAQCRLELFWALNDALSHSLPQAIEALPDGPAERAQAPGFQSFRDALGDNLALSVSWSDGKPGRWEPFIERAALAGRFPLELSGEDGLTIFCVARQAARGERGLPLGPLPAEIALNRLTALAEQWAAPGKTTSLARAAR